MHFAQRLHFLRFDIVQTHDQEADGRFHHAGQLPFLGQVSLLQLVGGGFRLQPTQLAAGTA